MDGDNDGNKSERSRVRENMEGVGSSEIGSKRVREKQKRRLYNKTSPKKKKVAMAACRKTRPKSNPKKTRRNE